MSFARFMAMLVDSAIHVPNAVSFNDSFEGSLPRKNVEARDKQIVDMFHSDMAIENWHQRMYGAVASDERVRSASLYLIRTRDELKNRFGNERALEQWRLQVSNNLNYVMREAVFISCWYGGEHESAAMWRLYSDSNNSVCVQSRVEFLKAALPSIYRVAPVTYIDFDTDEIPDALEPRGRDPHLFYRYKRKSFEHEAEVRAIVADVGVVAGQSANGTPAVKRLIRTEQVDMSRLVENIYVSPACEAWFYELVQKIVKKFGVTASVHRSRLEGNPLY